jgi:hypothetical protein
MKKLFAIFLFCVLILPLPLRADDEGFDLLEDEALWNDIEAWRAANRDNAADSSRSESWWNKNRAIEVGLANLEFGFPSGLLKETFVIELGELGKGYFVNLSLVPLYFKYNKDDEWGFRVFTGADAVGDVALSEKLLNFEKGSDNKSKLAAAVFAEAGADGFFHLGKFKLKAGFAGFIPFYYAVPREIAYNNDLAGGFALDYEIRLFSVIKDKKFRLNKELGFDLRLGAEYPLASFLDLGVDFTNIPLVPSQFTQYQRIRGSIHLGGEVANIDEMLDDVNLGTARWEPCKKYIIRPFKTLFWAGWRPLDIKLLSLIGSAGFQINPLYEDVFSMEGGLKARLNWENIIIFTAGVRYEDRLWKNGVDIALNCRAFELDLGIDMRSHDFADSWKGSFIGLSFGIKAGW